MRKFEFAHYRTPLEILMVCEAFDRGGFFDDRPEWCTMRDGVFILRDRGRGTYALILCRNSNGRTVWQ